VASDPTTITVETNRLSAITTIAETDLTQAAHTADITPMDLLDQAAHTADITPAATEAVAHTTDTMDLLDHTKPRLISTNPSTAEH